MTRTPHQIEEDKVALAVNNELCRIIDAKEPMDSHHVATMVTLLPEIQSLIDFAVNN